MKQNDTRQTAFLSGNEALARGAWECGVRVAAAYPGTPSTEILETLARYEEIESQWSVNEKVAYEVAYGAAVGGVRALYASKHVGLNVAMDPLMTSAYIGVNGGFVAVSADDPGLHSSQNEQDNRLAAKFAKIPLLEPSGPAEMIRFVAEAYDMSERFDIPVMLRVTTRVAHSKENVTLGSRTEIPPKGFSPDMRKYVMVPGSAYHRHVDLERRLAALAEYADRSPLNTVELRDRRIGFVTSGVSYLYVKEMYPDASVLKLGMPWPFPAGLVRSFAREVEELIVIEELEPFLEEEARLAGIAVRGKPAAFRVGELRPELLPAIVEGVPVPEPKGGPARKPSLCAGCPHAQVYEVLKAHGVTVSGDIGCYTLGALPPHSSLHTCVCMGGSVTLLQGLSMAGNEKLAAVIGDSTFVHTGIPGLINAVYNGSKGLILILDNATTAMTGNQPHPATGITLKGAETKKLVIEDVVRACGVENVDVVNPYKRDELDTIVSKRLAEDALSVVIARAPCMLLVKRSAAERRNEEAACRCEERGAVSE